MLSSTANSAALPNMLLASSLDNHIVLKLTLATRDSYYKDTESIAFHTLLKITLPTMRALLQHMVPSATEDPRIKQAFFWFNEKLEVFHKLYSNGGKLYPSDFHCLTNLQLKCASHLHDRLYVACKDKESHELLQKLHLNRNDHASLKVDTSNVDVEMILGKWENYILIAEEAHQRKIYSLADEKTMLCVHSEKGPDDELSPETRERNQRFKAEIVELYRQTKYTPMSVHRTDLKNMLSPINSLDLLKPLPQTTEKWANMTPVSPSSFFATMDMTPDARDPSDDDEPSDVDEPTLATPDTNTTCIPNAPLKACVSEQMDYSDMPSVTLFTQAEPAPQFTQTEPAPQLTPAELITGFMHIPPEVPQSTTEVAPTPADLTPTPSFSEAIREMSYSEPSPQAPHSTLSLVQAFEIVFHPDSMEISNSPLPDRRVSRNTLTESTNKILTRSLATASAARTSSAALDPMHAFAAGVNKKRKASISQEPCKRARSTSPPMSWLTACEDFNSNPPSGSLRRSFKGSLRASSSSL